MQTTIAALDEVLGGRLTKEQQSRLWDYLGIVLKPHIVTAFNYKQVISQLGARFFRHPCSQSLKRQSTKGVSNFDDSRLARGPPHPVCQYYVSV